MRISDWSSDVCSSDLRQIVGIREWKEMGKPLPPQVIRQLTDKQAEWVRQFVAGANATDAARLAGYAFPEVDGWRLTRIPAVQAAVVQERERVLKVEIGTLGLRRLTNILRNDDEWKDAPATLKAFAIGKALEHGGHGQNASDPKG